MDTTGSAPWYRLVGTLVLESGEPPGCWAAPGKAQAGMLAVASWVLGCCMLSLVLLATKIAVRPSCPRSFD